MFVQPPAPFASPAPSADAVLIKHYRINVSNKRLSRLKQKLALSDFPGSPNEPDVQWSRGVPSSEIKRLSQYWADGFNWRRIEANLNLIPQYIVPIMVEDFGAYDVHFIHQPSKIINAIPLLFLHGWPGSFTEVTKILPHLIQGGNDYPAFHVVTPSLVGFGFSSSSKVSCHKPNLPVRSTLFGVIVTFKTPIQHIFINFYCSC